MGSGRVRLRKRLHRDSSNGQLAVTIGDDSPRSREASSDLESPRIHVKSDIFRSAFDGDTQRCLSLLEESPQLLMKYGVIELEEEGELVGTVLHFACWANQENLAYELVKRGADPREIPLQHSSNGALHASLLACYDTYSKK